FPWADTGQDESLLLGWTMRMLESRPLLGPGDLSDGGFSENESVQIVLGELTNEELLRIWETIEAPYRLSVPYIARVVQIELQPPPQPLPVVSKKLIFEQIDDPTRKEPGRP